MQIKHRHKGFTLIELLVVIAIIGMLSTMAVVALNNARVKSRDAKRISDIKQFQTALELYFADKNDYPTGSGLTADKQLCNTDTGFDIATNCAAATVYMGKIPINPTPNGATYVYTRVGQDSYTITFTLEETTGNLPSGDRTASESGIL
jgi:general secretion pathway protein G